MWKAFVFGAILAGAIGPVAVLILGIAARRGFAGGSLAGIGAALADLLYAFAAFSAGALVLPSLAAHGPAIRIGCALVLVGIGASMLLRRAPFTRAPPERPSAGNTLLPTFLLTIVNPMTLVVFAGIVPQLPVAGSIARAAALALALGAGSATVQIGFAGAGAALGAALPGPGWQRAIRAASALGILAFGIAGLAGA